MRPLHRPLHPKFIFNADWYRMSEAERDKAVAEGKFRLVAGFIIVLCFLIADL